MAFVEIKLLLIEWIASNKTTWDEEGNNEITA